MLLGAGLLLLLGAGLVWLSRTMTTDRTAFPSEAGPPNPLPPCPAAPNCVRLTRHYPVPPDTLLARAHEALAAMDPLHLRPGEARLDAVFRVFVFKDDVAVAVAPDGAGSVLHLRSASRTGYSDFGVNGRRVRTFLALLEARLRDGYR